MSDQTAPSPRIQLRWGTEPEENGEWLCHYELVLPLRECDVRREVYDEEGEIVDDEENTELVVPLGAPTRRRSTNRPCATPDGEAEYADEPCRDGAHATWDAAHLGGLPIFIVTPNGAFLPAPSRQPPVRPKQLGRALDALDSACMKHARASSATPETYTCANTGTRVSWIGYTRADRLAVLEAAITAYNQEQSHE